MPLDTDKPSIRALNASDLERIVGIDHEIIGRSRRGFFQKRMAALGKNPNAFVALGVSVDRELAGFVLGQILDGEFGGKHPAALLDAIALDRKMRGRGFGHLLMEQFVQALRERGVRELRSQANWDNHDLLRFFAANGFTLAPRYIVERPATITNAF
jgi:GNAT superfamily N-acetyltransferase